jgi:uncharacterized protein YjdB
LDLNLKSADNKGAVNYFCIISKRVKIQLRVTPKRAWLVSSFGWLMKDLRFFLAILCLGSLAVSLNTCGGGSPIGQPTSISVTPENPIILVETTQQFTATGKFSVAPTDDITTFVAWRSSDTAVATVDSNGLARGLAAGTTIITATFGDVSGGTTLTVTTATLSSITVTPANPTLPQGTTSQFTAIAAFSDGTTHDVTTLVAWTSSNTAVATINGNGLVTALTAGTTTITAVLGAISASTTLTVT